ncbi:APC family permease [Patulibacter americanus]|uniref:APC family permease n=1 Tax=Patulibacter americanus TaxID=588672 RepID=UPI0003B6B0F5|nr:APC family permease [Patulibacter americanus]
MSTTAGTPAARPGDASGHDTKLARVLGLPALIFFGLAYMVPLTVWTTYGIVTDQTSGHLPAAYVVTIVAMLLTAYSYSRMVQARPTSGSAYTYASAAFGRPVGFMVGWALLLDYLFLPMLNVLVIGLYMKDYFPDIPVEVWIVLFVVLVTGLNILGVKLVANVNMIFVVAQFVFIAVFVVLVVGKITGDVEVKSFTAPFVESGMDSSAIFAGAAVLALSFLGFDAVSTLAEETRDPRRLIPRAIMLCTVIGGGLYLLQSYAGHLVFPDYTTFESVDTAGTDVMKATGGDLLNSFFTAVYVASAFASAMASQASVSRILFAMGRDGSLPRPVFGRLSERFRTPVTANLIVGTIGLSALFLSLTTVASVVSFGALAAFSFVNLAVVKHYVIDNGRRSGRDIVLFGVIPFVGFLVTVWLWTQLTWPTFRIGLPWVAIGFVVLLIVTRGFQRKPPAMYTGDEGDELVDEPVERTAPAAG